MNGAAGRRDIDGKTDRSNAREHMSQSGSRTSFKPSGHFLGLSFPDSKYLRELRVLRGEIEIVSARLPLQRTPSDGQAFKPGRRGDREESR